MWLPHSFITVLFAVFAQGTWALTNTTVDDADTSSFSFGATWTALSKTSSCTSSGQNPCPSQPDPSQTYSETWHVGTTASNAQSSFRFKGSAVYIFGIDQAGQAEIDFTLDGSETTSQHHYTGTQGFEYHALFFSATGLADQMHVVHWVLKSTLAKPQFALIDYAIVTSGEEAVPTTGAVTSLTSAPNATPSQPETTIPSNLGPPSLSEPVTPIPTPGPGNGSNSSFLPTEQGQSIDKESQPGSGPGQPMSTPPSAFATPSPTTHHPTSIGTDTSDTDTGPGGSTPPSKPPSIANSSASKPKTNLGAIVGGVIGAVFAALVIVLGWFRCRKVRRLAAGSAPDSRFLRIEDYYATQVASPPSSMHQVNPLPVHVSVDKSILKREHVYNNSEAGSTVPSVASLLLRTNSDSGITSDFVAEPAVTDTPHDQEWPSNDEGIIGDARSASTESRSSISSSKDNEY